MTVICGSNSMNPALIIMNLTCEIPLFTMNEIYFFFVI